MPILSIITQYSWHCICSPLFTAILGLRICKPHYPVSFVLSSTNESPQYTVRGGEERRRVYFFMGTEDSHTFVGKTQKQHSWACFPLAKYKEKATQLQGKLGNVAVHMPHIQITIWLIKNCNSKLIYSNTSKILLKTILPSKLLLGSLKQM